MLRERWLRLMSLSALALTLSALSDAEDKIRVLAPDFNADKEKQMMRSFLREKVHHALDQRLSVLEALDSPGAIESYQARLHKFFTVSVDLGSFERTPLNPEVTGVLKRDGYRIEKVLFESQPSFHVTGNLYLPEGEGPFPAVLHPCGHSENGKAYEGYQKANILLAKNGIAVLCFDPIGQGERKQLLNTKGAALLRASGEHQALGRAPVLLGRGLGSYMIWDGMRGLDYLAGRKDVDASKLGCMGNSGGGNLTAFLMALDPRIQAAALGCFITTTRMKNEKPGPGDPEQILFAQIREGLDHPDFAIIRAPKPTLILSATRDFVPIEGAWEAFRQAKRVYTKLGYPERVDLIEVDEKHGFTKGLREGAARFFSRWLKGEDVVITEPDEVGVEKEADLICTPSGQVLKLEGERTVFDLNAEQADLLASQRSVGWEAMDLMAKRARIREILSLKPVRATRSQTLILFDPEVGELFTFEVDGLVCPAVRSGAEESDSSNRILVFHDQGIAVNHPKAMESLLKVPAKDVILSVDLCDIGETRTGNWRFYGADSFIALMLGESFLKYRVEEILAIADSERDIHTVKGIHIHAYGELVPAALHAVALKPDLFESVTLHGGLRSWESLMREADSVPHTHNVIHGVLKIYDLPDLLKMIPEGKVRWLEE